MAQERGQRERRPDIWCEEASGTVPFEWSPPVMFPVYDLSLLA
jgi:hypothetical protein